MVPDLVFCFIREPLTYSPLVEHILQFSFLHFQSFVAVLGLMAVICLSQPLILLPSAAMLMLFYLVRRFYVATSRSVQRLEGVARSPLFSHLASSVRGLATIRAFRAEAALIAEFDHLQNVHTATW